jgi:hypothetical protein
MKTIFAILLATATAASVMAAPSDLTSYTFGDYVEVRRHTSPNLTWSYFFASGRIP